MNNFKKYNKKIIIATGGTGGHIFPAITFGKFLNKKFSDVLYITDSRGLINEDLAKLKPKVINVRGFIGKSYFQKLISIVLQLIATFRIIIFLKNKKIDLVLGFGSYVQVPVVLAAIMLKINIVLHEGNLILGNANKFFWKFAKVRASAFDVIYHPKDYIVIGMPVRTEIEKLYVKNYVPFSKNKKINILILGGSLGALILSRKVCEQICLLPTKIKKNIHVMHQSKIEDINYVDNLYLKNKISYEVKTYFSDIHAKLKKAALVICRAGASTISENLVSGLPAIYVPFSKSIDSHQKHNAEMINRKKAGWLINEEEVSQPKFIKLLTKLLSSKKLLMQVSKNCKKIGNPDASKKLYRLILGALNEEF